MGTRLYLPQSDEPLLLDSLATGEIYRSLSYQFRISVAAILYIVQEVCDAIVSNTGKTFLKVPLSMEEWITIIIVIHSSIELLLIRLTKLGDTPIAWEP